MHQINIIVFSVNWTEKRKPIRIKERKTGNLIFVLWIHKKWLNDRITGCLWANNRSARIGQILYWTNPFLDKSSVGQIIFWTNPFLDKWKWVLYNLLLTCIAHTLKIFRTDMNFCHKYNFWTTNLLLFFRSVPWVNQSIKISQKLSCFWR